MGESVPAALYAWCVLAQVQPSPSGAGWLDVATNVGLGGVLIWILMQWREERIADRARQRDDREMMARLGETIERQRDAIEKQTHAMLVLTLSVATNEQGRNAARDMLHGLGDHTPR